MRPKPAEAPLAGLMPFLFGIPWTIFSLVFLFMMIETGVQDQKQYNKLTSEGVTAQAVITKLEIDDSDDSTTYFVYFRFTAPSNGAIKTFEHYDKVSQSLYKLFQTGDKVEIIYAASDPNFSQIKAQFGSPSLFLPLVGGGVSLLFVVVGLSMLIFGFLGVERFLQLRSEGQLAHATIFDRWEKTDSDGSSYFVAYAFKVSSRQTGQQIISNAEQSLQAYKKLGIGSKVKIKYLPTNPQICHMVDFHW